MIRQELSGLSGWPTIPQLFVDGELVGGCDIITEMYQTGELQKLLGVDAEARPRSGGGPGRHRTAADHERRGCAALDREPASAMADSTLPWDQPSRVHAVCMPVALVTDTCHYLPRELVERCELHEVSLYVHSKGGARRESEITDYNAFFDGLAGAAELPTTSQPSIGDFRGSMSR